MENPKTTAKKIKELNIQGARAIAVASLLSLKTSRREGAESQKRKSAKAQKQFITSIKKDVNLLIDARPTEPLVQNTLNFVLTQVKLYKKSDVKGLINVVKDTVDYLLDVLKNARLEIIKTGEKLIKSKQNVFTHCHSSTVEAILINAWKNNKKFKVFNTETRPLFQGRLTAKALRKQNIPVTMVADSAASFLISETSGKQLMMDKILLGADAVLPDGSVINKIGSFGIAQSAHLNKVPLYVVTNLLKYDTDGIIPIEIRAEEEVWKNKPKGLKIINFAFDTIPAKYITGIICEFGVIKPSKIKTLIKTNYPWLK